MTGQPNFTQRVFDLMDGFNGRFSVAAIVRLSGLPLVSVKGALRRLRSRRVLRAEFVEGMWVYTLRPGAERPRDRRGHCRD